jgi:hypothetical protein
MSQGGRCGDGGARQRLAWASASRSQHHWWGRSARHHLQHVLLVIQNKKTRRLRKGEGLQDALWGARLAGSAMAMRDTAPRMRAAGPPLAGRACAWHHPRTRRQGREARGRGLHREGLRGPARCEAARCEPNDATERTPTRRRRHSQVRGGRAHHGGVWDLQPTRIPEPTAHQMTALLAPGSGIPGQPAPVY